MDRDKLLNEMTPDMVSPKWKPFVETVGIKPYHKLSEMFGGQKIHISKEDNILKEAIRQNVINDYESGGYSHQLLADKYNLSVKTVGKYLQEANAKKPT